MTTPDVQEPRRPADFPTWVAPWANQVADLFFSGTTAAFVLHGNTYDLFRMDARAERYGVLAEFLAELRKNFEGAQAGGDDRIVRSLQDSIAMAELRLDNFGRAKKNADFVSIELDRIEGKIQTLAEMAVNRQDPDFLSSQVDSAAESMRQTEKAVSELQHLTGLADQLEEPPPIMETDLRGALRDHA